MSDNYMTCGGTWESKPLVIHKQYGLVKTSTISIKIFSGVVNVTRTDKGQGMLTKKFKNLCQ